MNTLSSQSYSENTLSYTGILAQPNLPSQECKAAAIIPANLKSECERFDARTADNGGGPCEIGSICAGASAGPAGIGSLASVPGTTTGPADIGSSLTWSRDPFHSRRIENVSQIVF